jgi:hypothetical protein
MQQTLSAGPPPLQPSSSGDSMLSLHKAEGLIGTVLYWTIFAGNPARLLPSSIANRLGPIPIIAGPVFWLGVVGYGTYRLLKNRNRRKR